MVVLLLIWLVLALFEISSCAIDLIFFEKRMLIIFGEYCIFFYGRNIKSQTPVSHRSGTSRG